MAVYEWYKCLVARIVNLFHYLLYKVRGVCCDQPLRKEIYCFCKQRCVLFLCKQRRVLLLCIKRCLLLFCKQRCLLLLCKIRCLLLLRFILYGEEYKGLICRAHLLEDLHTLQIVAALRNELGNILLVL